MDSTTRIQPWKGKWPNNISAVEKMDPSVFPCAAGPGKGAQPNEAHSADGTKVMRLDKITQFLEDLKAN